MKRNILAKKAAPVVAPATVPSEILDEIGAAAYLRIAPRTLRLWRQTRGLPHFRITPKCIRYRRIDLDGWLTRHHQAIAA